ncbi:hypothetical protein A4A49_28998 [Nicotiana attenuata]|uniref:Uncharacterized protein n=1 Tax=Nicotiana attenuata TaxID=49451 RepID=A0A1J6KZU2_NICAT|nr:hypothetical protein A4A49_28998 [Nicotiana attenuata]
MNSVAMAAALLLRQFTETPSYLQILNKAARYMVYRNIFNICKPNNEGMQLDKGVGHQLAAISEAIGGSLAER